MKISLKGFLEQSLFNNGNFCRIDIPIRVMAVEDYSRYREINNLWWRMQYAKLWYHWGQNGIKCSEYPKMIMIQMERLTNMVRAFEDGGFPNMPLTVGSNYALKDGSHRLACHIYYNSKELSLEMLQEPYHKPIGLDETIKNLYSDNEWCKIIAYKNYILKRYGLL